LGTHLAAGAYTEPKDPVAAGSLTWRIKSARAGIAESEKRSRVQRTAQDRLVHLPIGLRSAVGGQDKLAGDLVDETSETLDYVGSNCCDRVWDVCKLEIKGVRIDG